MPSSQARVKPNVGENLAVPYRRFLGLLAFAWTAVALGSLAWNLRDHAREVRSLTSQTARALLEKDLLYRQWSILRGGVYTSTLEPTKASEAAGDVEREIRTPSGRTLTLLNPAVVSRQIFELQDERMKIRGHITSLDPLRPQNGPDAWERKVLEQFGKDPSLAATDASEATTIETTRGERYFRMMRPLITTAACLRCHEEHGRTPGQVRGGISVTLPMRQFEAPGAEARMALGHAGLWLIGAIGLYCGALDLRRHVRGRRQAEAEREQVISQLREALAEVKTLSGLIPICASCKKIRDDQGYWTQIETYLKEHSNAQFSHGLCLDCLRKLYPDIAGTVEAQLAQSHPASLLSPPSSSQDIEPRPPHSR
jgi:Protein of unknown function (DUF3365)